MAGLLLRAWEEVFLLFLNYLQRSSSSPFINLVSIFAKKEYQRDKGNLSHFHMMIRLHWGKMSPEEKVFLCNLIRASISNIVKIEEIQMFLDHGILRSSHEVEDVMDDAAKILAHNCNDRYLVKTLDGRLRCQKLNNLQVRSDNTKHEFMPLSNNYSQECSKILCKIELMKKLDIDLDGINTVFESRLSFFTQCFIYLQQI